MAAVSIVWSEDVHGVRRPFLKIEIPQGPSPGCSKRRYKTNPISRATTKRTHGILVKPDKRIRLRARFRVPRVLRTRAWPAGAVTMLLYPNEPNFGRRYKTNPMAICNASTKRTHFPELARNEPTAFWRDVANMSGYEDSPERRLLPNPFPQTGPIPHGFGEPVAPRISRLGGSKSSRETKPRHSGKPRQNSPLTGPIPGATGSPNPCREGCRLAVHGLTTKRTQWHFVTP